MRVLVTGGCGFVGAELCRQLVNRLAEVSVTSLDNNRRQGSETNRASLERLGVRVVHGDIRLPSDIEATGSFDWVIDAAAEPSVLAGTAATGRGTTRRQLVEHNLLGTANLLEAAARWEAGVVLLSTSRAYSIPALVALPLTERRSREGGLVEASAFGLKEGAELSCGASKHGIDETFSTASPISLYGATKLAGETLALEFSHAIGTPLVINRCGVMAGAGQFGRADQGIFSWWIHSWAARRPLRYIGFGGKGWQVRDCLHPADLADLVVRQMKATTGGLPEMVNVSGGATSATSLAELSAWCSERLGPHSVGGSEETRPYDIPWIVLDHRQASARHGWVPQRSRETIFEEIAIHAEQHPDWLDRCGG
jgi:CDP-paratose 2-epimerase